MCAGQDKTPGEIWAGAYGTAGLSWDTDQEDSMTPVSEEKTIRELFKMGEETLLMSHSELAVFDLVHTLRHFNVGLLLNTIFKMADKK